MGNLIQYVHWHYYSVNGKNMGSNLGAQAEIAQLQSLLSGDAQMRHNAKLAQQYEILLNKIQRGTAAEGDKFDLFKIDDSTIQLINNQFQEYVRRLLPNLDRDIDISTLSSAETSPGLAAAQMQLKNQGNKKEYLQVKEIQQLISHIQGQLNIAKSSGKIDGSTIEKQELRFQQAIAGLEAIQANHAIGNSGAIKSTWRSGNKTGSRQASTLVKQLNSVSAALAGPSNVVLGTLAEIYYAYILSAANRVATMGAKDLTKYLVETLENAVANGSSTLGVTGDIKLKTTYKVEASSEVQQWLLNKMNGNKQKQSFELDGFGNIATVEGSQMTADLQLILGQNMGGGSATTFSASVKNYKGGIQAPIHILSGAPLSSILGLYSSNFLYNYYNMVTKKYHAGGIAAPWNPDMTEANRALKYGVLFRGLKGIRSTETRGGEANFFIVNDSVNGGVHVYCIDSILDKIVQDSALLDMTLDIMSPGFPQGGSIKHDFAVMGSNTPQENAEYRSAQVLATIHQWKITAALKANALNQAGLK